MYDDAVIVSKVNAFGMARNYLLIGLAAIVMVVIICLSYIFGNGILVILWLVISVLAIAYYLKKGIVKRITVSPDHINLEYYFRNVGRLVLYNEIDSIQNYSNYSCRQIVNLKDDSSFGFGEAEFENYDDIKSHIFRYMVAANRKDATNAGFFASEHEVVVSAVGSVYYVRIYAFFIALAACSIMSGYDLLVNGYDGYWAAVLILVITGILGRIFYVGKIKRITVSPGYMVIDYVGNKPQEVIDYTQIVSNRSVSFIERGGKGSIGGYRKQLIDLDDGRQLIYTDMKFDNYEDLKNHIYRYMVAANQNR